MEAKLQREINRLLVILKAHIYEPKIEDVVEISFKAGRQKGIEEVVEYLNLKREGGYNFCVKISWDEWNAKLKEWGVE